MPAIDRSNDDCRYVLERADYETVLSMLPVSKNDEFALNTRNCVPQTRNCVLKMMNFAEGRARGAARGGARQILGANDGAGWV